MSEGVKEMRHNLSYYYKDFELENNKGMFLINDDNPLFNLAFVQNQMDPCVNQNEEMELIDTISKSFTHLIYDTTKDVIGDLIKGEEIEGK